MIKTLVSIEVDLASSLAIRFACQLGALISMEIHPVYVKEFASDGSLVGAGWASRTLEREMIQEGKAEISEMITAEMDFCPALNEPRVIYGDREAETMKIMQMEEFGLYVEGSHFSWNPTAIYKRLHSKFYKRLTFPVVWVRALRKVNQVLILCLNPAATETLARVFQKIWKDCPVPLLLAVPSGNGSEETALQDAVKKARSLLEQSGCKVAVQENLPSSPEDLADETLNFPLVAVALERDGKKDQPSLQWLAMIKTASLVAFY
ncbi:MAG: hypothetical protein ACLP5H_05195 [Desulfomonilaceae bacterium]